MKSLFKAIENENIKIVKLLLECENININLHDISYTNLQSFQSYNQIKFKII